MQIPVVNEQDEVIGYKERSDRDSGQITRVTGLWVTDENGNILLAQRARHKKNNPGLWGPAVSGTIEKDETYESNIIKEAKEEINLEGFDFVPAKKFRMSTDHEYFAHWFTVIVPHDYPLKKEDNEVETIKWFSKEELLKLTKEKPEIFLLSFPMWAKYFCK